MTEWIDVNDRLPENIGREYPVLALWFSGHSLSPVLVSDSFIPKNNEDEQGYVYWCEIPKFPEPPKGGE